MTVIADEKLSCRPRCILRLKIADLSSQGAKCFVNMDNVDDTLETARLQVFHHLYQSKVKNTPEIRSVTLILRPLDGVAYTSSKYYDHYHKEIHLSTNFLEGIAKFRKNSEIRGILCHEMTHCWQWNALGTAPAGLIEGIADWVRLKSGLGAPGWNCEPGLSWDEGYHRTAYFLDYIERRFGHGAVSAINLNLRDRVYCEVEFWHGLFGKSVLELWNDYASSFKSDTR